MAVAGAIYSPDHKYVIGLMVLLYMVDFGLGLLRSMINKKASSKRAFKGGLKLFGYVIMLLVGHACDTALHTPGVFFMLFMAFILISDSISILENAYLLGFNVPIWIIQYLHVAQHNIQEKIKDSLGVSSTEEDDSIQDILHKKDEHIDTTNPEI